MFVRSFLGSAYVGLMKRSLEVCTSIKLRFINVVLLLCSNTGPNITCLITCWLVIAVQSRFHDFVMLTKGKTKKQRC